MSKYWGVLYSFDEYLASGGESFSVSRFGYEFLKGYIGESNFQLVYPEDGKFVRLLTKLLGGEGRNIVLQIKCAFAANKVDLLYYPTDRHAWLLAILRKYKICRTPILMVSHFTFNTKSVESKFKKFFIRFERTLIYHSVDRVVFASENLMNLATEDYNVPKRHRKYVGWGASLEFYGKKDIPMFKCRYFLAAGRVNRDYKTLIDAFRKVNYELIISCSPESLMSYEPLPNNITVFNYKSYGREASSKLRNLYQNCIAVLLPINQMNQVPNGASVLVEAVACGKPVVVSDLKSNFFDIRKEGIGLTVKMHDSKDWIDKIQELASSEQYPDFVSNCNKLASRYNYEIFAREVYGIMVDMNSKE